MKKFFLFVTILLLVSSYAVAADYWHFGIGLRAVGVMPLGDQYNNAMGEGLLITFGNPDSRFTTQFEVDDWSVTFHRSAYPVSVFSIDGDSSTIVTRSSKFVYSGLGAGFFEKYRTFDFSPRLSNYIIAGLGGYFLNGKFEESNGPFTGTTMKSRGFFSVMTAAMGTGFEGRLNEHINGFVEARYVGLFSRPKEYSAPDMFHGYFGVRYIF